ncbi:MAG: 5-(carboxyamino)imidazole ribonucleotide synthase [Planctomycetota bacterium]
MKADLAILGGGQLAQMLGAAAQTLGITCRALDPSPNACAAETCEMIAGNFDDPAAIARLVGGVDALTFEFENVPTSALLEAEKLGVAVRPNAEALRAASDRLLEKNLFRSIGMRVPPFVPVSTTSELHDAADTIGVPFLLKARSGGYDGRSQAVVRDRADVERAWSSIGYSACIAESMVSLRGEVSVITCRAMTGETRIYPLSANEHRDGILIRSVSPADVTEELAATATAWARALLDRIDYVGVLALELFVTPDGLLANEFAPRVHNTGHATIEASQTSQFENHIRAVLGLPLGSTEPLCHSVMRNFIGNIPRSSRSQTDAGTFVHDYGKIARPGRKLGHITFTGDSPGSVCALESRFVASL